MALAIDSLSWFPSWDRNGNRAMASPGELIQCIAEAFGVAEVRVFQHDRNLAEAGFRSKGGRGTSAATMTSRDAAAILIAVAGSAAVKDSLETFHTYATLPEV